MGGVIQNPDSVMKMEPQYLFSLGHWNQWVHFVSFKKSFRRKSQYILKWKKIYVFEKVCYKNLYKLSQKVMQIFSIFLLEKS